MDLQLETGWSLRGRGQICLKTNKLMAIISTRITITIRKWNVRTMFETGKIAQVAAEMRNYNLATLGTSAIRWTGSTQWRLAAEELLLYSGHDEDNAPHTLLSQHKEHSLDGRHTDQEFSRPTFQTKKWSINMDVIQSCAPKNDSKEAVKEEFQSRLSTIIQKCPRQCHHDGRLQC